MKLFRGKGLEQILAHVRGAFREVYPKAKPIILEPIMKLEAEGPAEFQGAILRTIMSRRGLIIGTNEYEGFCRVEAEVPLATMFGYSTDLRSSTQGKAEFTMEFARYAPALKETSDPATLPGLWKEDAAAFDEMRSRYLIYR